MSGGVHQQLHFRFKVDLGFGVESNRLLHWVLLKSQIAGSGFHFPKGTPQIPFWQPIFLFHGKRNDIGDLSPPPPESRGDKSIDSRFV